MKPCLQYLCVCVIEVNVFFMVCQEVQNTDLVQLLPYILNEGNRSPESNLSSQEYTASWYRSQTEKPSLYALSICFAMSALALGNALDELATSVLLRAAAELWWTFHVFCKKKSYMRKYQNHINAGLKWA